MTYTQTYAEGTILGVQHFPDKGRARCCVAGRDDGGSIDLTTSEWVTVKLHHDGMRIRVDGVVHIWSDRVTYFPPDDESVKYELKLLEGPVSG